MCFCIPVLVLAYRKGEFDQNGVPADVIEIVDSKQDADLVLKNGTYEIVIKDQNYKVVERYNLEIK